LISPQKDDFKFHRRGAENAKSTLLFNCLEGKAIEKQSAYGRKYEGNS
jgi:hypothetical protein